MIVNGGDIGVGEGADRHFSEKKSRTIFLFFYILLRKVSKT